MCDADTAPRKQYNSGVSNFVNHLHSSMPYTYHIIYYEEDFRQTHNARREKNFLKFPPCAFTCRFSFSALLCVRSIAFLLSCICGYTETERLKCIYEGGYVEVLNDAGNIFFNR